MRKENLKIPQVFRILVIDDQLCSDKECVDRLGHSAKEVQKCIVTRYLDDVVKNVVHDCNLPVEVVYAKDPDEGVAFWLDQIFDLTLVDSDFSKSDTSPREDSTKRNFLDLNLQFSGAYLFRFLREMSKSRENRAGRDGCKIVFWTGLGLSGEGKQYRAKELLSILTNGFDGDPIWFIPKKEDEINDWVETIEKQKKARKKNPEVSNEILGPNVQDIRVFSIPDCVQEMKTENPVLNSSIPVQPECVMERIKRLYPVASPGDFMRWCHMGGYVFAGYLYEKDGLVCFADYLDKDIPEKQLGSGNVSFLSPLLRRRGAEQIDKEDANVLCSSSIEVGVMLPHKGQGGWKERERIVAAATPLTGCSAVGEDNAIALLDKKVKALLDGPFGRVVLKTVYLNSEGQWENFEWPRLQAQERGHVTRCYRSTKHARTLWNTGTTANESFSPKMLNRFLLMFSEKGNDLRQKVIVSLGSKYPIKDVDDRKLAFESGKLEKIWSKLFSEVFAGLESPDYPLVEINVRHYLRECLASNLSGNEYLNPSEIKEDFNVNGCGKVDAEFCAWLGALDKVATEKKKKVLLKLPFRGDILHFIRLINDFRKERKSTVGITLINSYKSAEDDTEGYLMYSPAWYGLPAAWGDADRWGNKQCQMSGQMLAASRNVLIPEIASFALDNLDMEIHISGGIVDHDDVMFCLGKAPNIYVQIGTWALMHLDLSRRSLPRLANLPPNSGGTIPQIENCRGCDQCSVKCSHSAFKRIGGKFQIDIAKCINCKECVEQCKCNEVKSVTNKSCGLIPKRNSQNFHRIAFCIHELCDGCGRCSRTFYCDAFLDRRGKDLPPLMEPRNCTGCGLCVQTCPKGALQLFEPKDFVLLVGERKDPKLVTAHKFLFSEEIPHLVFYDDEDKYLAKCDMLRDAIKEQKIFPVKECLELNEDGRKYLSALRAEVEIRLKKLKGEGGK